MRIPQRLQIVRIVIHGIVIQRLSPAGELGSKLPHHISSDARLLHHRVLPWAHDAHTILAIRDGVFFEKDGLAQLLADGIVLRDPRVAPRVVVPPLVSVHVDGAVVKGWDGQILLEIDAFVAGVGVTLLVVGDIGRGGGKPAFVAEGNHMLGVEIFDVSGGVGGPFGNDAGGAAGAAGLVH